MENIPENGHFSIWHLPRKRPPPQETQDDDKTQVNGFDTQDDDKTQVNSFKPETQLLQAPVEDYSSDSSSSTNTLDSEDDLHEKAPFPWLTIEEVIEMKNRETLPWIKQMNDSFQQEKSLGCEPNRMWTRSEELRSDVSENQAVRVKSVLYDEFVHWRLVGSKETIIEKFHEWVYYRFQGKVLKRNQLIDLWVEWSKDTNKKIRSMKLLRSQFLKSNVGIAFYIHMKSLVERIHCAVHPTVKCPLCPKNFEVRFDPKFFDYNDALTLPLKFRATISKLYLIHRIPQPYNLIEVSKREARFYSVLKSYEELVDTLHGFEKTHEDNERMYLDMSDMFEEIQDRMNVIEGMYESIGQDREGNKFEELIEEMRQDIESLISSHTLAKTKNVQLETTQEILISSNEELKIQNNRLQKKCRKLQVETEDLKSQVESLSKFVMSELQQMKSQIQSGSVCVVDLLSKSIETDSRIRRLEDDKKRQKL